MPFQPNFQYKEKLQAMLVHSMISQQHYHNTNMWSQLRRSEFYLWRKNAFQ